MASRGAAMASGRGVSAARAQESEAGNNNRAIIARKWNAMTFAPRNDGLDGLRFAARLRRHRLGQVFRDLVEKAGGGQPALVGADQEREILGHVAGFDGGD